MGTSANTAAAPSATVSSSSIIPSLPVPTTIPPPTATPSTARPTPPPSTAPTSTRQTTAPTTRATTAPTTQQPTPTSTPQPTTSPTPNASPTDPAPPPPPPPPPPPTTSASLAVTSLTTPLTSVFQTTFVATNSQGRPTTMVRSSTSTFSVGAAITASALPATTSHAASPGAVAGSVIAAIVGLASLTALAAWYRRRRRRNRRNRYKKQWETRLIPPRTIPSAEKAAPQEERTPTLPNVGYDPASVSTSAAIAPFLSSDDITRNPSGSGGVNDSNMAQYPPGPANNVPSSAYHPNAAQYSQDPALANNYSPDDAAYAYDTNYAMGADGLTPAAAAQYGYGVAPGGVFYAGVAGVGVGGGTAQPASRGPIPKERETFAPYGQISRNSDVLDYYYSEDQGGGASQQLPQQQRQQYGGVYDGRGQHGYQNGARYGARGQ